MSTSYLLLLCSPPTPSSYWMAPIVDCVGTVPAGPIGADNWVEDTVPLRIWHVLGRWSVSRLSSWQAGRLAVGVVTHTQCLRR